MHHPYEPGELRQDAGRHPPPDAGLRDRQVEGPGLHELSVEAGRPAGGMIRRFRDQPPAALSSSICRKASAAGGSERPAFRVNVIGRRMSGPVMRSEGRPGSSSSSIAEEGSRAMPRPARTSPTAVLM